MMRIDYSAKINENKTLKRHFIRFSSLLPSSLIWLVQFDSMLEGNLEVRQLFNFGPHLSHLFLLQPNATCCFKILSRIVNIYVQSSLKLFSFPNCKWLDLLKSLKFPKSQQGDKQKRSYSSAFRRTNSRICLYRKNLFPNLFPATFVFLEGPLKHYIATFHVFYLPCGTIKAQRFINMHSVNVLYADKVLLRQLVLPLGNE